MTVTWGASATWELAKQGQVVVNGGLDHVNVYKTTPVSTGQLELNFYLLNSSMSCWTAALHTSLTTSLNGYQLAGMRRCFNVVLCPVLHQGM